MATRFWVGGTGNWDASTTTHWSATTGGSGGASVPTSADSVTFDTSSGTATIISVTTAVSVTSLTLAGHSIIDRLLVQSSIIGTPRVFTVSGATTLTYVDFQDITATAWTGTSLGDCGGNSGITLDTPTTRYWVAGTGSWSDTAHWATSTGGTPGATVPLPQDTVRMDANSFTAGSSTPTVNMPRACKDWNYTGATNSPLYASSVAFATYGSFTGCAGLTRTGANVHTFAGRATHTIASVGFNNWYLVTFAGPGGTYTIQDAFQCSMLTLNNGTFDANGFSTTIASVVLNSSATCVLNMGSGSWGLWANSGVWSATGTGLTLNASTSTIVIHDTSSATKTFAGGGKTYNNLTLAAPGGTTTALTITGANTFNTLTVPSGTTLTLPV
jgi:hypothetical protein